MYKLRSYAQAMICTETANREEEQQQQQQQQQLQTKLFLYNVVQGASWELNKLSLEYTLKMQILDKKFQPHEEKNWNAP